MIEINLSSKKKSTTDVGGFDLSYLNVKMLLFAILFLYVPEGFLSDYYQSQADDLNKKERSLRKESNKIKSKVRTLANIKRQLDALGKQEKKLASRLSVVQEIIGKRQNPFEILKYIAENMPKDIWFTKLSIIGNTIEVLGYAKNWKNIGETLESLKSSIFFNNISYSRPENTKSEFAGDQVESFKITGIITRFK